MPGFEEIYDAYKEAVYAFTVYLTRDPAEAEELFQEAWLRIVRKLPEEVDRQRIKAWIFTVVANLHKDELRKKMVRKKVLLSKKELFIPDPVLHKDLGREISRAITLLPERQRKVFVLKEISGFRQEEVSAILGIPVGTVKSLMHRAVKRLRKHLSAYHPKPAEERG